MSDALEGFEERKKWPAKGGEYVTYDSTDHVRPSKELRDKVNNPSAYRCFTKGTELALVPAEKDETNAYSADSDGSVSGAWVESALEIDTLEPGRYGAEIVDGMIVVDFAPKNQL